MNKKGIERRIKYEASQMEVPNLKQQILANVANRKVVEPEKRRRGSFAIRFSYVLSVFIILMLAIVFIDNYSTLDNETNKADDDDVSSETNDSNQNSDNTTNDDLVPGGDDSTQSTTRQVSNAEKAYAKGAATLSGFVEGDESLLNPVATSFPMLSGSNNYKDMTDEINKYFHSVSRLLSEEDALYEIKVLTEGEWQYELKVVNNVLGDLYETTILYNEILELESKDEKVVKLDGIIISSSDRYSFEGTQVSDEDECEITLILTVSDHNFIMVSQEIEGSEREFKYSFYNSKPSKNTKPYKEIEIEIEAEEGYRDGIFDIEVEIKEQKHEYSMKFSYDKNGDNSEVDVRFNEEEFKIKHDKNDQDHYSYHHKGKDNGKYDHVDDYDKHHGGKKEDEDVPSHGNHKGKY